MKRLLLDTNVVLDFALKREPFYENAQEIFVGIANSKIHGFITASMATDIFYLLQKTNGKAFAMDTFNDLLILIDILSVYGADVYAALQLDWSDFEDALQMQVAMRNEIDTIITRNVKDFKKAKGVKVLTPMEFLAQCNTY